MLGALAGVIGERSGIINISIEACCSPGAFTSALVGSIVNLWVGIAAAMAVGSLLALLLAWLTIRFGVDQVIIGFAINFFVLGMTSFLDQRVLTPNPEYNSVPTVAEWKIPGLHRLPILGPILFEQTFYVYCALGLVAVLAWALFRSKWGLRTRAVG